MPLWNRNLVEPALTIAGTDEPLLRVVSGPGTGKTFAMKRRVTRLLEEDADPSRILAVTFTRNAAASLAAELKGLEVPGCQDIDAGTLHGFCFRMLNDGDVWLQFHKAMLIGELIPEALRYLRNNPECPYLTAYDDIIVDEYQDLNKAEQSLLDLLSMNANLVIVGDENHSIYSFRHAHPEGIVEFADTHDGTYDESLVQCRSPIDVVALANHLISHNHDADYEPSLKPFDGNPEGEIHILQWPSINQEINGIVAYIEYLTSDCDYNPRDIFVLCPRRMIGYGIRDALRAANVSSHCFYPDEALSDDRGQLSFCLLSLLADRDDRVALRFWLGFGSSTWLEGQYRRLRNHCEDKDLSPWDALQQIHDGNDDLPGINKILERFDELTDALSDLEKPPRLRTR